MSKLFDSYICRYTWIAWSMIHLCFCGGRWVSVISPVYTVRHYYSLRATTLRFVVKLCSSCLKFFTPSCPSPKSSHVYSCFPMHFGPTFVNASLLLTYSNRERNDCSLSQTYLNLCNFRRFRTNCGAYISRAKQLRLLESVRGY